LTKTALKAAIAATVQVLTINDSRVIVGWGSGSIVTAEGFIVTNAHVVSDMRKRQWMNKDGLVGIAIITNPQLPALPRFLAKVQLIDFDLDFAVVKPVLTQDGREIPGSLNLPFVQVGDSNKLEIGDELTAIGFPGVGGDTVTVTRGIVSGFGPFEGTSGGWIKTDLAIGPGNSGGMVINENGEIVGVPTQVMTESRTGARIGLVRAINLAQSLVQAAQSLVQADMDRPPGFIPSIQGVVVTGKIVALDTGKPIYGAEFVVLRPAVTTSQFLDYPRDSLIAAWGKADANGVFQTFPPLERGKVYSVMTGSTGYRPLSEDNSLNIRETWPASLDVGVLRLERR
jgi:S1-C subfamily serine protease